MLLTPPLYEVFAAHDAADQTKARQLNSRSHERFSNHSVASFRLASSYRNLGFVIIAVGHQRKHVNELIEMS